MTTADLNLDRQKCHRRNVLAALRDGAECSPIRWMGAAELAAQSERPKLPADEAAALALINRNAPKPVKADDVYIHYMEGASDRFISDRYMFLHKTTLANIAADAEAGFAFMNSHRTGRMSQPSELPFGRAFTGQVKRYTDANGSKVRSAQLGVYMTRGIKPNGANGPSTDDLSKMIDTGSLFDVSMGLYGGTKLCDVCGENLYAADEDGNYLCKHYPGSNRKMDSQQVEAQKLRGVPGGVATYSLVDARPGEVSAVYGGAIPGAGFAKAFHRLNRGGPVRFDERDELLHLYPDLSETFLRGNAMAKKRTVSVSAILGVLGLANQPSHLNDDDDDNQGTVVLENDTPTQPAQGQQLHNSPPPAIRNQADPEKEELRKQVAELRQSGDRRDAEKFAADMTDAKKIVPAESAELSAMMMLCLSDDRTNPIQGVSRAETLRKLYSLRTSHTLGREAVVSDPEDPKVKEALGNGVPTTVKPSAPADKPTEEDLAAKDAEETKAWAEKRRRAAGAN